MNLYAIFAIYALFWVMCGFVVMPFTVKTHDEVGAPKVPGQADSAPHVFRAGRIILFTTLLSAVLFGLFYANYVYGWIGASALDLFGTKPPV